MKNKKYERRLVLAVLGTLFAEGGNNMPISLCGCS